MGEVIYLTWDMTGELPLHLLQQAHSDAEYPNVAIQTYEEKLKYNNYHPFEVAGFMDPHFIWGDYITLSYV